MNICFDGEVLYKYLRKEHAEKLLKYGVFRIGTLFDYRNMEKYGDIIGDHEEGMKVTHLAVDKEYWTPHTQPDFSKSFFDLSKNSGIEMSGFTLRKNEKSLNCFIFSTTEQFDSKAMEAFGYDACIEIKSPKSFFNTLSKCFRHKGTYVGAFKCAYTERKKSYLKQNNTHPALIKEPSYAGQTEVRTIWDPIKRPIKPKIIKCKKAIKYCKLYCSL